MKYKYSVVSGVDHGVVDSNGAPHYTRLVSSHRTLRAAVRSYHKACRHAGFVEILTGDGRRLSEDDQWEWNAIEVEIETARIYRTGK